MPSKISSPLTPVKTLTKLKTEKDKALELSGKNSVFSKKKSAPNVGNAPPYIAKK